MVDTFYPATWLEDAFDGIEFQNRTAQFKEYISVVRKMDSGLGRGGGDNVSKQAKQIVRPKLMFRKSKVEYG